MDFFGLSAIKFNMTSALIASLFFLTAVEIKDATNFLPCSGEIDGAPEESGMFHLSGFIKRNRQNARSICLFPSAARHGTGAARLCLFCLLQLAGKPPDALQVRQEHFPLGLGTHAAQGFHVLADAVICVSFPPPFGYVKAAISCCTFWLLCLFDRGLDNRFQKVLAVLREAGLSRAVSARLPQALSGLPAFPEIAGCGLFYMGKQRVSREIIPILRGSAAAVQSWSPACIAAGQAHFPHSVLRRFCQYQM